MRLSRNAQWFSSSALFLLLADCSTKRLAVEWLEVPHRPVEVVGDFVRFTLAYNAGGAFGFDLGPSGRAALVAFSAVACAAVVALAATLDVRDRRSAWALGMILGGALGNLGDRLLSPRGVVDFVDVGVGALRWWTFNVADVAIAAGAALLILASARERPVPPGEPVDPHSHAS